MSQVKTGVPPEFAVKSDLSSLIPAVASNVGIEDIGKAINFYKQHRRVFAAILAVFGIGKKKGGESGADPGSVPGGGSPGPTGNTGTPGGTGTPATTPSTPPTTPGSARRVAGLKARYMLIERKNRLGQAGGGRYILPKAEFDEIVEGSGELRPGDRVHVDVTPVDQFGVAFQPGDEANRLLLEDPNDEAGPLGASRIRHHIEGDGELTNEYNDYGCTPVILVPWEGRQMDSDRRSTVGYFATYHTPDGDMVTSNRLRALTVVE